MNSVINFMANIEEALCLFSEFTDHYGLSAYEDHIIAAVIERKYFDEICNIMTHKGFSLRYFEVKAKEVLVEFAPTIKKI